MRSGAAFRSGETLSQCHIRCQKQKHRTSRLCSKSYFLAFSACSSFLLSHAYGAQLRPSWPMSGCPRPEVVNLPSARTHSVIVDYASTGALKQLNTVLRAPPTARRFRCPLAAKVVRARLEAVPPGTLLLPSVQTTELVKNPRHRQPSSATEAPSSWTIARVGE